MEHGPEPGGLSGKLLVAAPALRDPNFSRTVVFLVEHTDEGAAGVVLNRPTDTELSGPLEGWRPLAAEPSRVFVGGPMQQEAAVCLGRAAPQPPTEGWQPLDAGLGVIDLSTEASRDGIDRLRVFAGYAGWAAGQLEAEIDEGAWFTVDADPGDVLTASPDRLWRFVLRRQGGRLAMVADYPADPGMN